VRWKPYPRYKPSGVEWLGEVPEAWGVDRVKWSVASLRNGIWGDEPDGENDIVCVRVADFDRQSYRVVGEPPTVRTVDRGQRQNRQLAKGDLLIEKSGGGENQLVGAVVSFDHAFEAVCSNFVARLVPAEGTWPRYWAYVHASMYSGRVQYPSIKQTTGIQNLDTTAYFNEAGPFPPPDEQHTIADFLDRETARLDTLIDKKRQLIERLREKRTALISHTVTRGLPPDEAARHGLPVNPPLKDSGIEWLGEVPAHWEVVPLGRLAAEIQTGPFGSQLHQSDYVDDGVPLVNPVHLVDGVVEPSDDQSLAPDTVARLSRHVLSAGDIVFARRGEIGRCAVVAPRQGGWVCGTGCMVVRLGTNSAKYFSYVFGSEGFVSLLTLNAVGTTMLNLNPSILRRMFVPCPPKAEQRWVADYLDRETTKIDRLVDTIQEAIDRLQEYRAALITAAVTGKIDVRDEAAERYPVETQLAKVAEPLGSETGASQ
jgi:type I restriction enzyme S subunit